MTTPPPFSRRIDQLRTVCDSLRLDGFLVTFLPHLRYLSNFSGSNGVGIVLHDRLFLLTDGRYFQQVKDEVKGWKVHITTGGLYDLARKEKLLRKGLRIGFDGNSMLFAQFQMLKGMFPNVKFLPKADTIEKIAAVKDRSEIDKIKQAVAITDQTFTQILPLLKPGVTELDIAAEISYRQRKLGSEADAFETIVASGERGALPHGRASTKKIQKGEMVTLDFGCIVDGYHSDMTRTVGVGRLNAEAKKVYQVVLEAQMQAVDASRAGIPTKDLDLVARSYIRKRGYEKFFRHSLGHGIGLQIHEAPRISVLSKSRLENGNVVTIEPGIYIPGFGGVRIEDDVVIRNGECEVLNTSPKQLFVL